VSFLTRPFPTLFDPDRRRVENLVTFAGQEGLQFSVDDPLGLVDPALALFRIGVHPHCVNVLWGTWQGLEMAEADLWFGREQKAPAHGALRYSIAVVEFAQDVPLPSLRIARSGSPSEPGPRPIEFESEEFNRSFEVRCTDREFAFQLVDPRMMQWLLSVQGQFGFQVGGRKMLVHAHHLDPSALIPLLGTAKAFHDHVPDLVFGTSARNPVSPPELPATAAGQGASPLEEAGDVG